MKLVAGQVEPGVGYDDWPRFVAVHTGPEYYEIYRKVSEGPDGIEYLTASVELTGFQIYTTELGVLERVKELNELGDN